MDAPLLYACCFCGKEIPNEGHEPVQIWVRGQRDGGDQGIWSHLACFKAALHPSVPVAVALDDGEESGIDPPAT